MKNFLRNWLGINEDVQAIAGDMNIIHEQGQGTALQVFELFHALPYSGLVATLTAQEAAALTQPEGVQANSIQAILVGILLNARQGRSVLEIRGELSENVRTSLTNRGFKVEDTEGTGGKTTHILWT